MGKKRPRSENHNPPPNSDIISCSSRMELLSEEKPLSSVLDTTGSSLKFLNAHPSAGQHHQSLGRSSSFFKRSRQYYGHQYSRRNLGNLASASTSCGKGTPLRDDKLSHKLATQCSSDSGRHSEVKENPFPRPGRIRSSFLVDGASTDPMKMLCGICQKPLRRKPFFIGVARSSTEVSVVAVLDCGHVFHADCLEQNTSFEARRDPPCPMCVGLLAKNEDLSGDA